MPTNDRARQRPSRLVIVTGRLGSGKTTLGAALARALRVPLLSRDELKEGMGRATNAAASDLFFATLELWLRAGVDVVGEAAFQHRVWAPRFEVLSALADIRLVVCEVPPALAWQRVQWRIEDDPTWVRRHPFPAGHRGADEPYDPPRTSHPTLVVDTSGDPRPGLDEVVAFLGDSGRR